MLRDPGIGWRRTLHQLARRRRAPQRDVRGAFCCAEHHIPHGPGNPQKLHRSSLCQGSFAILLRGIRTRPQSAAPHVPFRSGRLPRSRPLHHTRSPLPVVVSSTADPFPATQAHNPTVPGAPSSLATPDSENDPDADSQTTLVPGVSTVPTQSPAATSTPPITRKARFTAPADVESDDESESSPDQQPHKPVRPNPPRFLSMEEDES